MHPNTNPVVMVAMYHHNLPFQNFRRMGLPMITTHEDGDEPESTFAAPVSFMAGIGVWFVLGRAWDDGIDAMGSSVDVRWRELSQCQQHGIHRLVMCWKRERRYGSLCPTFALSKSLYICG